MSEQKVVRVVLGIPNEGHCHVEAYTNRLENWFYLGKLQERGRLENHPTRFEFMFITLGRIFTPLAREEMAKATLEANADYLYMVDDDMICPNDTFEKLYAHDVDLVAPLAFTRNFPHHAVLYDVQDGWDSMSQSHYFINHYVDNYPKDTLVECDAVGFGAALIKAEVLRGTPSPRFMSTCGTGEDIYFCRQARKKGFRVFMDTGTKLGHLSHPIEVTEEYVAKVRKEFGYKDAMSLAPKHMTNGFIKGEAKLILGD